MVIEFFVFFSTLFFYQCRRAVKRKSKTFKLISNQISCHIASKCRRWRHTSVCIALNRAYAALGFVMLLGHCGNLLQFKNINGHVGRLIFGQIWLLTAETQSLLWFAQSYRWDGRYQKVNKTVIIVNLVWLNLSRSNPFANRQNVFIIDDIYSVSTETSYTPRFLCIKVVSHTKWTPLNCYSWINVRQILQIYNKLLMLSNHYIIYHSECMNIHRKLGDNISKQNGNEWNEWSEGSEVTNRKWSIHQHENTQSIVDWVRSGLVAWNNENGNQAWTE